MKRRCLAVLAVTLAFPAAAEYVQGYVKKDGTYVPGYFKTEANTTKLDNYSTKGNVNPYTGERGYVNPYAIQQPKVQQYPTYTAPKYEPYKPYTYENPYTQKRGW